MTDISDATAAPITFEAGGKTYEASPLTIGDWGALQAWLSDEIRAEGIRMAEQTTDQSLRMDILKFYAEKADRFNLFEVSEASPENAMLNAPKVGLFVIYLGLRHRHPDVQLTDIDRIVPDPAIAVSLCNRIIERSQAREMQQRGGQSAAPDPST